MLNFILFLHLLQKMCKVDHQYESIKPLQGVKVDAHIATFYLQCDLSLSMQVPNIKG